jgi:ribosome-associated protein
MTQTTPSQTAPAAAPATTLPSSESLPDSVPGSLHALILQSLDDDQAQEIVSIPLEGKTSIADHMVIASGRSTRQVAAMAQKLTERVKHGVVVHLFRPEVRSFYNLERMWAFDGPSGAA